MTEENKAYVEQLECTVRQFLKPIKNLSFPIAIKALTGFQVLNFDPNEAQNKQLLDQLIKAATIAGRSAFDQGIVTDRPNEAGNQIEPFVLKALEECSFKAAKPLSKSGKKKSAGYPDIQIEDMHGRTIYLDCKTYNQKTRNQSFRTFYFSPSEDPKITKDALHLLLSFELDTAARRGGRAFIPISWHLYTLDKLIVQLKHEFNAGNKKLYKKEVLLAEGKIS